jgi:hypothetical protein
MGRQTFSANKETALPKIKSEDHVDCVFDSQGAVHKEFVEEGCTGNAGYYKGVLNRLISRIRRLYPDLYCTHNFFLLHDNTPVHSAALIRQFLAQKQVTILQHLPYSPDLAPVDHFLFPKVKLQLKGARFDTITAIQKAVTDKLQAIPTEDFPMPRRSWKHVLTSALLQMDPILNNKPKRISTIFFSSYYLSPGTSGPY